MNSHHTQDRQKASRAGVNPLVAGAVGAAIGGVAVALADKNTRKRMGDTLNKVAKDMKKEVNTLQTEAKKSLDKARGQAETQKDEAQKKLSRAKDKVDEKAASRQEEIMDVRQV